MLKWMSSRQLTCSKKPCHTHRLSRAAEMSRCAGVHKAPPLELNAAQRFKAAADMKQCTLSVSLVGVFSAPHVFHCMSSADDADKCMHCYCIDTDLVHASLPTGSHGVSTSSFRSPSTKGNASPAGSWRSEETVITSRTADS